ncbi:MAG: hypothetical protein KAU03_01340 [Candidatus Altiarchaeales archaeon]|nr:hypothetical protein [Candidatus Altiarchaeales archaeon]
MQYLKIPAERISSLLGEKGEVKEHIQRKTKTTISVDDTLVVIEGESIDEWDARNVVLAVGRGFEPEIALRLLDEDMKLEVIHLKDFINTKKEMLRKKGRIIGTSGKMRRYIENLTDTYVTVYGNTVSIIGSHEGADIAKEAVLMLVRGSQHTAVYKFLDRSRHQRMKPNIIEYYETGYE